MFTTLAAERIPLVRGVNMNVWVFASYTSDQGFTLLLPSSKRTFSQSLKRNCISEVARIGSIIVFHMSKPIKSQVLHTV